MVRRKIIWTVYAKDDLKEILAFYIRRNGNSVYSKKLNQRIKKTVSYLLKYKEIGRPTDLTGIRVIIEGDYQIFYENFGYRTEVLMVWDTRQDPDLIQENLLKRS